MTSSDVAFSCSLGKSGVIEACEEGNNEEEEVE